MDVHDENNGMAKKSTASSTVDAGALNIGGFDNKKREQKIRKKDPKSWYNISKQLATIECSEKFNFLEQKYIELYNELRVKEVLNQETFNKLGSVLKEKDQLSSEFAKNMDIRTRLESVCRELQKQNKEIKEENIARLKKEEERRKDVTSKFQRTLTDIHAMMDENQETNVRLRDDNQDMAEKLMKLYQLFEVREGDLKKLSKQLELEQELARASIQKVECELKAEKEICQKEVRILQEKLITSEANCKMMEQTIKKLETHVNTYKNQYDNFEGTLNKSNKMFEDCRGEIMRMSKKILTLEKESVGWKEKFNYSTRTVLRLTEEKSKIETEVVAINKRLLQLQKLCRQLQFDRSSYLKLLKANGIEPVSEVIDKDLPVVKEQPTKKELELKHLQTELKLLQTQLSLVDQTCNNALPNPSKDAIESKPDGSEVIVIDSAIAANNNDKSKEVTESFDTKCTKETDVSNCLSDGTNGEENVACSRDEETLTEMQEETE